MERSQTSKEGTSAGEATVQIHGLGAAGDGVGRLDDGRVIFVAGGLPGDLLRVELGAVRKKTQHGKLIEILEPSKDRTESLCEHESCGGCALRGLSKAAQAQSKRTRIVETMRRIGHVDVSEKIGPVRQFGEGWGYRHRVRLHAAWEHGGWRFGYHARRSNRLVPLESCPVLWPELQALALSVAAALEHFPRDAGIEQLRLAWSRRDERGTAYLSLTGSARSLRRDTSWVEVSGLSGIEVVSSAGRWRHGNLELRYDHARSELFDLRFEPGTFTQAHPEANDQLVDAVLAAVRPRQSERVLELHAGVGNFSLPIAMGGVDLTTAENNRGSAILARRNARRVSLNLKVLECDDIHALEQVDNIDCVVLDPPRTGALETVKVIAQSGKARVVYVSCDVATLARDTAVLLEGGYELTMLHAFDMFPQTPHVEVLAVFAPQSPP